MYGVANPRVGGVVKHVINDVLVHRVATHVDVRSRVRQAGRDAPRLGADMCG